MPREKECYRDYLVRLDEKFPEQEILNMNQVASFLGLDARTVKKRYGVTKEGISKVKLARALS